jgi:queuosine precursor transporter
LTRRNTLAHRIGVPSAALLGYIGCIVLANVVTARYGLVPVWPGLDTTAGTYAAGAALLLRDAVQETAGRRAVLAAIVAGGLISWLMSSPALALASAVAFLVAESADMAVYTPLRHRGWARAVLASNLVGAVLDTLLFLTLAGFPLTAGIVTGQLVGKLLWATLLPVLLVTSVRAVGTWRTA